MTTDQNALKRAVARAALEYVEEGRILGVGTGSTVDCFIDLLPEIRERIPACVSSSERSTKRLEALGFKVLDMNDVEEIGVYVDGADEIDPSFAMVKGGGGALTREKIVASVSKTFVCIADASKQVDVLGRFPLPVEVIPMAARAVKAKLEALGATVTLRDFVTDNGNAILDAKGLAIAEPEKLEAEINMWPGVVTVGLFAKRGADVLLLGTTEGVKTFAKGE
ncbi:ribose-5-phosphate isomerase RpiA [Sutterella megalosphaeroides]|uniref:Ribose-5-phosphate isomerase A n=1 Tax=Sutterella megalosphaeroides TaxID=2494234 RepID=A0A2Z6I8C9_9BURK|nr:ribose-5-phosphate isomerase RpiA [Sutterella megalosphaeroides]BBF22649.1 ribose-5-phosphate isomerase A [Sutterella megalosphaeroides]